MASQLDKSPEIKQDNFHIDENQVRLDFGRLTTTTEGFHRCSTPKSSTIGDETQEIVDISKQCLPSESIFTEEEDEVSDNDMSSDTELHHWPSSEADNDDDYDESGSSRCCDPYESYDWEC
ncbi:unnamed protein product [Adineta steineri]|uniref:Uncharacterized protein n=1 Tax=Adineta steineri TaxID=433720 RepID=A0A815T132_9BILA|nr:unnamed protein product [Adineta steineri]CAF1657443.1 unnamed protein product [Adineta steineri]